MIKFLRTPIMTIPEYLLGAILGMVVLAAYSQFVETPPRIWFSVWMTIGLFIPAIIRVCGDYTNPQYKETPERFAALGLVIPVTVSFMLCGIDSPIFGMLFNIISVIIIAVAFFAPNVATVIVSRKDRVAWVKQLLD